MIATTLKVGAGACALFTAYAFGHVRGFTEATNKTSAILRETTLDILLSTRAEYLSKLSQKQTELQLCQSRSGKYQEMVDVLRDYEEEHLVSAIASLETMLASIDEKITKYRIES